MNNKSFLVGPVAIHVLTCFALLMPAPCRAWGPVGHRVVAIIAESRLQPETRKKVEDLLKKPDGTSVPLYEIANCADKFAYDKADTPMCAGIFKMALSNGDDGAATAPWHFIDIPIQYAGSEDVGTDIGSERNSLEQYCPNNACVVAQIAKDVEQLQKPDATLHDKQMALMFLVHFVGDVHQPLHASDELDANNDPASAGFCKPKPGHPLKPNQLAGNAGGNCKSMSSIKYPDDPAFTYSKGKNVNLHALWDDLFQNLKFDYRLEQGGQETLTPYAEEIAGQLGGKHVARKNAEAWTVDAADPLRLATEAAIESYAIAKNIIYPQYHESLGKDTAEDYSKLTYRGSPSMQQIANQRLQIAGVRLAALIEQALGSSSKHTELIDSKRVAVMMGKLLHATISFDGVKKP